MNIRDKANGKVIGKILKNDMINNGWILLAIDNYYYEIDDKGWYEVYYMPTNAKDGKDAIHGFVLGSQIKIGYN